MTSDTVRLAHAFYYSTQAHADQRRKGERAEPYVNHVAEVADLLARATDGADVNLVIAGLLHDVVEDTPATLDDLEREFGKDVAGLVGEVTDDKRLPRKERKRVQIETAAGKSDRARMLKIADKTSNLRAIAASPPKDWSLERQIAYFDWAKAVVDNCRHVNRFLDAEFDRAFAARPAPDHRAAPTARGGG